MPARGGKPAKQRVAPRFFVEVEALRVERGREFLDGFCGEGIGADLAALADLERELDSPSTPTLLGAAWREPRAHVVGVTGPPGVGKSSLCSALVASWRKDGKTVGVVTRTSVFEVPEAEATV